MYMMVLVARQPTRAGNQEEVLLWSGSGLMVLVCALLEIFDVKLGVCGCCDWSEVRELKVGERREQE